MSSTSLQIHGLNCIIAMSILLSFHVIVPTSAFCPPNTSAAPQTKTNRFGSTNAVKRTDTDHITSTTTDIADIEEITNFATENGITLSFTSFGPGYRGVAVTKNDPENILGYIEGFLRPAGKILHADKMEIFQPALNSARREESSFKGGGTYLGPGLLIAFVCLLHGKESGCQTCEFLAIDDAEFQHKRLIRYYKTAGFDDVRYVGEELKDIPDRLVWGGCGTLMTGNIDNVLRKWTRIIRGSK